MQVRVTTRGSDSPCGTIPSATEREALRPLDLDANLPIELSTTSDRLHDGPPCPWLDPLLRARCIILVLPVDPCFDSERAVVPWKQATGYPTRPLGSQAARATAERSIERTHLGEPRPLIQALCMPPREVALLPRPAQTRQTVPIGL